MKCLRILSAIAAFFAGVALAVAAEATVTVPVGSYVQEAVALANQLAVPLVAMLVAWFGRMLPASVSGYLSMIRVDQLLQRAVDYALNAVKDAADGKVLTVDVGNKVLAEALRYAVAHAPALVQWAGGADAVRQKIIARLKIEADAKVIQSPVGGFTLAK